MTNRATRPLILAIVCAAFIGFAAGREEWWYAAIFAVQMALVLTRYAEDEG